LIRGVVAQQEQHSPGVKQGYRSTVVAAACLGIVWFGDAVIYVVLPLYAAAFGCDALMVGVLLSVNRVVRILGYGWVGPLARAYGSNLLTAAACAAGALSTLAYGLLSGFVLLFVARMASPAPSAAPGPSRRCWRSARFASPSARTGCSCCMA
jgi:MFS family permease